VLAFLEAMDHMTDLCVRLIVTVSENESKGN
jgi:hypothetical protein